MPSSSTTITSAPGQGEPRKKKGLGGILKVLFAVGILFLVVRAVPWRDTLIWSSGGESEALAGTIVGDWKLESIRFELDAELDLATLPAGLREVLTGRELEATPSILS